MGKLSTLCAQASLDVGEPAFATATPKTDLWLLIEHPGQWAPKIFDTPSLPQRTKDWLAAFMADHPTARPQLIRRSNVDNGKRRFFFVTSGEDEPAIWSFLVDDLAELETLDLGRLVSDPRALPERRRHRPLFLVCTHGKRDACCARLGPAVFRSLQADFDEDVWQSSHLGGHRFSATMMCFPHGHSYGRLDTATARRVARGYAARQLTDLLHYRGRTTYAPAVQAAEFFLRQSAGVYGIDDLTYKRGEIAGTDRWQVRFAFKDSGETHELTVTLEEGPDMAVPSCGKGPKLVRRYRLESHRQLL